VEERDMIDKIKTFKGKEIDLEYLLTGNDNEETIMFVHGAGANLRQFLYQHECLSENYKVLSVSLRGHGKSSLPRNNTAENYTLQKQRDDLIELILFLKLQNINYIGNSAGGVIGYLLIEEKTELFKSLITFGTTAEMKFPSVITKIVSGIDKLMIKFNSTKYLKFSAKHTSKNPEAQKFIFELFTQAKEAIPYFRANLGNYNYTKIIENMKIPYLLIKSEEDTDINSNLKSTLESIESNPQTLVKILEKAGHIANLDQPEAFNSIITTFIKDV